MRHPLSAFSMEKGQLPCEGCGFGAWEPGMVLGFLHVTLLYSFTSVWFKELDHHTCQGTYSLLQSRNRTHVDQAAGS